MSRRGILLFHDQDDRTIPAVASMLAASQPRAAGFAIDLDLLSSVGHTISAVGAQFALQFLERAIE